MGRPKILLAISVTGTKGHKDTLLLTALTGSQKKKEFTQGIHIIHRSSKRNQSQEMTGKKLELLKNLQELKVVKH